MITLNKASMRFALDSEVDALKQIALSLSTFPETEKVVFFGSRSRGDFDGSSDMDILVVVSDIMAKNRAISVLHDIELEYDVPVSPVIFTSREYEVNKELKSGFIENVDREGLCFMTLSVRDKIELSRYGMGKAHKEFVKKAEEVLNSMIGNLA